MPGSREQPVAEARPDAEAVGRDRVRATAGGLEIVTDAAMDDWVAGGHRRTQVLYRDRAYLVAEHRLEAQRHVYALAPLDPASLERPSNVVAYDAGYVQQRDLQRRAQQLADLSSPLLRFALALGSPLLGLLPSDVKLGLHARLGVHVTSATMHSLYAEMILVMLALLFFGVDLWSGLQLPLPDGLRLVVLLVGLLILPDFVVRTGRVVHGGLHQYGFYEWLFRRLDEP